MLRGTFTRANTIVDDPDWTQADYDAADEVLRLHPGDPSTAQARRELFAGYHAYFGSSKFRLYFGLREPLNHHERLASQLFRGDMSEEQMRESIRQHVTRPADLAMLDEIFGKMEQCLEEYSLALQTAADTLQSKCSSERRVRLERRATTHFNRARETVIGMRLELETLSDFLAEVRIEAGLGHASLGSYSSNTAMDLALLVFFKADEFWSLFRKRARLSRNSERYIRSVKAAELLFGDKGPNLPIPQNLLTLLNQERTAARIAFRKQAAPARASATVVATNATIHVQTGTFPDLKPTDDVAPKPKAGKKPPILTVDDWSQLAIGIDCKEYLAFTPAPEIRQRVVKSSGKALPPVKGQLMQILKAFADSETGQSVPMHDLMRVLDKLPPAAKFPVNKKARIGALRSAVHGELSQQTSAAKSDLSRTLNNNARRFRNLVAGPIGKGVSCFELRDTDVTCRFIVRYLFRNENGTFYFGQPPD